MIRKLQQSDREVYMKMAAEFYASDAVWHDIPKENLEKTFSELMRSDEYAECFVFEDGDTVVGYALLAKTFSQEAGGLVIWIEELYLSPESRGKGFGGKFFDFLFQNRPAARYRLEIEPENERAVALYRKKGFEIMPYGQMVKDI